MEEKNVTAAGQGDTRAHERTSKPKLKPNTEIVHLREFDDVDALLMYKYDADQNAIAVKGHGVIRGTKDRADGCRNHQKKVSFKDTKLAKQTVLAEIVKDCQREKRGSVNEDEDKALYACLKKIEKRGRERLLEIARRTFGWSQRTAQSTLSYLINSIASVMKVKDTMEAVGEELVNRAIKSKNSGDNEEALRQRLQSTFNRAERLFRRLQREFEELQGYEVVLPVVYLGKAATTEQKKALTAEERTVFVYTLWALAQQKIPEVFGAIMMFYAGLRTAEAVGPLLGEIEISEDERYATYFVSRQIQNGKETWFLKTDHAYRQVVLPYGAVRFIQLRIDQLRAAGYSDEQIKEIPLVSFSNKARSFVSASILSGFVKEILMLCGVAEEQFAPADEAEKQVVARKERQDITAYILRRDFATRGIYCCSITPAEMDYLIGHASDEIGYASVRAMIGTAEWKKSIADRLDSYVMVPELTNDPVVVPITIKPGDSIVLNGRSTYRFNADEDCILQAVTQNAEAADYLHLETDGEYVRHSLRRTTEREDADTRKDRFIPVAAHLTEQQYEHLRRKADTIAKGFLKRMAAEENGQ